MKRKLSKDETGFSGIEILFAALVVALISVGGVYLWHRQHSPKIAELQPFTPPPTSNQSCDKTCLESAFEKIKLPSSLTFASKTWANGVNNDSNTSSNASWTYTYTVPGDQHEQTRSEIYKAEAAAGFELHTMEAGASVAYSKKVNAEIVNGELTYDSSHPAPTRTVVFTVENQPPQDQSPTSTEKQAKPSFTQVH